MKFGEALLNWVVIIPLSSLYEMFRPRDLPIGTYIPSYSIKGDALHLQWTAVEGTTSERNERGE